MQSMEAQQDAVESVQAELTSAGVSRLPRSLAQWAPPPAPNPFLGLSSMSSSRLSQVLLKHFHPTQSLTQAARQWPNAHAARLLSGTHAPRGPPHIPPARKQSDAHAARGKLSAHAASTSSNPRIGPYGALPNKQEHVEITVHLPKARRPVAASRQPTAAGIRTQKPAAAAGKLSRAAAAERRPQSAGSSAVHPSKGSAVVTGTAKSRARSVSPNSQYHFSCTSSVPDNGSSWYGDAASAMSQQGAYIGKGRAEGRRAQDVCPVHPPMWQTGASSGPLQTTFVVPDQHLTSPSGPNQAQPVGLGLPRASEPRLHRQTDAHVPKWLSEGVHGAWTGQQPAVGLSSGAGVIAYLAVMRCMCMYVISSTALGSVYAPVSLCCGHCCHVTACISSFVTQVMVNDNIATRSCSSSRS